MFIMPMWESENHRKGFGQCTRLGYVLRSIADLTGFFGLILSTVGTLIALFGWVRLGFDIRSFILVPTMIVIGLGFAVAARIIEACAMGIAKRKQFHHDYKSMRCTWIENGTAKEYPFPKI